jgi:hypothetical protein
MKNSRYQAVQIHFLIRPCTQKKARQLLVLLWYYSKIESQWQKGVYVFFTSQSFSLDVMTEEVPAERETAQTDVQNVQGTIGQIEEEDAEDIPDQIQQISGMEFVVQQGLTRGQLKVMALKLRGFTYERIIRECRVVSYHSEVSRCIKRGCLGYPYRRGPNGTKPYLCEMDAAFVIRRVQAAEQNFRPMSVPDFLELAHTVKMHRILDAIRYCEKAKCPFILTYLQQMATEQLPPSRTWANFFCIETELNLGHAREIDMKRISGAHEQKIIKFLSDFEDKLRSFPAELIFGADESMIDAHRVHKHVLSRNGCRIQEAEKELPHISTMLAHSCCGKRVPLFAIIPKLTEWTDDIRELIKSQSIWIVSSPSGWQTRETFFLWTVFFCHWAEMYRSELREYWMRHSPILLIVDGHTSRACPAALQLMRLFNIELLILPAHTSHILQMFDIGIAADFKRKVSTYLRDYEQKDLFPTMAAKMRWATISAAAKAWDTAASYEACRKSGEIAGICPFNINRALENRFVIHTDAPIEAPVRNNFNINGHLITKKQFITDLQEHLRQVNRDFRLLEFNVTNSNYVSELYQNVSLIQSEFRIRLFSPIVPLINRSERRLNINFHESFCDIDASFREFRNNSGFWFSSALFKDNRLCSCNVEFFNSINVLGEIGHDHLHHKVKAERNGDFLCIKSTDSFRIEKDFVCRSLDEYFGKLCNLNWGFAETLQRVIIQESPRPGIGNIVHFIHSYFDCDLDQLIFKIRPDFALLAIRGIFICVFRAVKWLY